MTQYEDVLDALTSLVIREGTREDWVAAAAVNVQAYLARTVDQITAGKLAPVRVSGGWESAEEMLLVALFHPRNAGILASVEARMLEPGRFFSLVLVATRTWKLHLAVTIRDTADGRAVVDETKAVAAGAPHSFAE